MKRLGIELGLALMLLSASSHAQERRGYEGVVGLKGKTIGTLILLEKFAPIESGSILEHGVEFSAAGNRYEIDERKGRITYSGPDGEGSRFIQRLERRTGRFEELGEDRGFSRVKIATVAVNGRPQKFRVGRPALWKQAEAPFESFERIEELLGKEIFLWLAEADARTGRVVAVEEPAGMNIPLKKPKEEKKK